VFFKTLKNVRIHVRGGTLEGAGSPTREALTGAAGAARAIAPSSAASTSSSGSSACPGGFGDATNSGGCSRVY
jgi:hypothetical protein